MTVIQIGELCNRLSLETPLRSGEAGGGAEITWSPIAEVWGAVRALGGTESVEADGIKARASHEIWIRWRSDVVPQMRFVDGARVFDIVSAADAGGRRRFLKCVVVERLP